MLLVHAADLHIDSPMRGLERYEGAPVERMRAATREALRGLVALCLQEEADVLLLAGDVFDGDWKDYATGLFFARQMAELQQGGVRVVSIRGNHDAASQIQKQLALPENVRELATRKPETVVFEDLGLAVHGQGFERRAVTEDLAQGYPEPIDGMLNVGLLHTCLNGRPGHAPYAPCRLHTLVDRGYAYWALGHVHTQEILHEAPWVAFSGNLQGRHAKETGPKGALLVRSEDARVTAVEPRVVDVVRWSEVEVDVSEAADAHDVVDLTRSALETAVREAEDRPVAARVVLVGSTKAHEALARDPDKWQAHIRSAARDVGEIWIEPIRTRTSPSVSVTALAASDDAVGHIARTLIELGEDEHQRRELVQELSGFLQKLPPEARSALSLEDAESTRTLFAEVASLLMARLSEVDE